MHQSPQKEWSRRRDKPADLDLTDTDAEAERRLLRAAQPKARRAAPRGDPFREPRADRYREDE
jgi:hypothetical protein